MLRIQSLIVLVLLAVLAGCSTDRHYASVTHAQVVAVTREAIQDETNVRSEKIEQTDTNEAGGVLTTLKVPSEEYASVSVTVDSRGKFSEQPQVGVHIGTDKFFFTRHRDWEWRLQELVALKLNARTHGPESQPTALPPVPLPAFGPVAPPLKPVNEALP